MNKRQFFELFKVNLLYANPQLTTRYRDNGKSSKKIFRSILSQYLLIAVAFGFLYGMILMLVDFTKNPGMFTIYTMMFVVMTLSQAVPILFNVFYDSKDFQDYLPLPFKQSTVFLAKFSIILVTVLPFLLPELFLFLNTAIRSDTPIIVGIILSVLLFVGFFFVILSLSVLLVSLLVQTKTFNRHKNTLTSLLLIVPVVGMVAGMMYLNNSQTHAVEGAANGISSQMIIYPFYPFHQILVHPFNLLGIVSLVVFAAISFVMWQVTRRFVVPKMYAYAAGDLAAAATPTKHKNKKNTYYPIKRQVLSYNLKLVVNPTLLTQTFSMIVLIPAMMMFSLLSLKPNLSDVSLKYWIIAALGGFFYGIFTIGPTSIAGLIISLDRENLLFIRSLPINFKKYLKEKFNFAVGAQFIPTAAVIVILSVVLRLPVLFILGALLGLFVGIYIWSSYYFYRDYRYLNLTWSNISQLFSRGGGNMAMGFSVFGIMIAAGIVIGSTFAIITMTPFALLVTAVFLALFGFGLIGTSKHYRNVFWDKKLTE